MDDIILAFYGTGILLPILVVLHLLIKLIVNGQSQVLLCMECDQCMNACPNIMKHPNASSPKDIMVGVKEGKIDELYSCRAIECNFCGACEKKCPRGLSPYKEVEKLVPRPIISNKINLMLPN